MAMSLIKPLCGRCSVWVTCAPASVVKVPGNRCFGDELLLLIFSSDSACCDQGFPLLFADRAFGCVLRPTLQTSINCRNSLRRPVLGVNGGLLSIILEREALELPPGACQMAARDLGIWPLSGHLGSAFPRARLEEQRAAVLPVG